MSLWCEDTWSGEQTGQYETMSKSQHRGEYVNRKIVKLWDDSNAYHIELEGGDQMNVNAPIVVETSTQSTCMNSG